MRRPHALDRKPSRSARRRPAVSGLAAAQLGRSVGKTKLTSADRDVQFNRTANFALTDHAARRSTHTK